MTRSRRAACWLLVAVAAVLYIRLQVLPLLGDRGSGVPGLVSHANDFKHIYLGSWLLAHGESPYDPATMLSVAGERAQTEDPRFRTILPFVYLPFTGVVLAPLTTMSFAHAVVAWQMINHLLLLGALALLARAAPEGWRLATFGGALLVAALSWTVYRQNNAGQLNMVLLFGHAVVFAALSWDRRAPVRLTAADSNRAGARRSQGLVVGALAAFFTLFKLSPGILFVWFVLRKEWRAMAAFVAACALLVLLSCIVAPPRSYLDFLSELPSMGYGRSSWESLGHTFWRDPYNQSLNALFHRLLVDRQGSDIVPWVHGSAALANGLTWAATIMVVLLFARAVRGSWRHWSAPSLGLAITTSLLIPSIMWDHYLVQLFAPAIFCFWGPERDSASRTLHRALVISAMVIAALPVDFDSVGLRSGIWLTLMSTKLVPPLILFFVGLRQLSAGGREGLPPAGPRAHDSSVPAIEDAY